MNTKSICRPPAGQIKHTAGGETVLGRGKPGNHRRGLVQFQEPSARDFRQHIVDMFLAHLVKNARAGRGGRDAVHGNVAIGQFLAQ